MIHDFAIAHPLAYFCLLCLTMLGIAKAAEARTGTESGTEASRES